MEKTSMEDSSQKTCVRDAHLQKTSKGLKQNKGNLESINEVVFEDQVDLSVSNVSQRIHFMNACIDTPSVYSCAVDCFLEICFRLFVKDLHEISPDRRSNIFEVVVGAIDIYEAAIISSDTNLLSQLRQPIWDYIVSNCSSFVLKNCAAEFSQIFPGNIFNSLSSEEQILFETSEGTYSQCDHNNQRTSSFIVSHMSEFELANFDDFNCWPQFLSPNDNDVNIQCGECETLVNANLTNLQASKFRFVEFDSNIASASRFQNEIYVKGQKYSLQAMVRHRGDHCTCCIATHGKNWLFLDDMCHFTVAISSLGEFYFRYPTGWFFADYVRETDFIPYPVINDQVTNENFRNSCSPESNPRKRRYEDKNYSIGSKIKKARSNVKYYEENKDNINARRRKKYKTEANKTKINAKRREKYKTQSNRAEFNAKRREKYKTQAEAKKGTFKSYPEVNEVENNDKENKKHSTQPNVQKGNTESLSYNSDIKQNIKKLHSSLEMKIVQCNICFEAWPLSTSTKV